VKRIFFIFSAIAVLFIINNSTLADNGHVSAAVGDTGNKCQKIAGPTIPPDTQKVVLIINGEELFLSPGVYWIWGREKNPQALCLEASTFINLPPGVYVLYTIPEK